MNGMALCAGAGGLELGLHLALGDAYRTVVGVEWEASAASVLVARQQDGGLPPFPIWDSVATFDGRPWRGVVDIVSGGFPCQPFSVAGKRGGDLDPRHLWPHIARIIGECQPRYVFLENVPGLLTTPLADGRGFAYELVEADLHELGYIVASGLFTAAEVGAPHQRERLFILAHREGRHVRDEAEWQRREDPRRRGSEVAPLERSGLGIGRATAGPRGDSAKLADPGSERRQQDGGGAPGEEAGADGGDELEHRRDAALADAAEHHWRRGECGTEPWRGAQSRNGAGSAGADDVDDALGQRGRGGNGGREDAADAHAPGEEMGNPAEQRRQGLKPVHALSEGWGRQGGAIDRSGGATLPPFPPGPGDRDAWQRILAVRPDLAPAITQSEIRGVADGVSAGLDLSRAARLRLTGNAVVAPCAARAFRTLWRELADAGHAERTDGRHAG